ncbi:PqiB family protein [Chitinasiproducens palmae]|uniref:PqiB family protein n=1 Tax=Chitinasiproducens palmae TaxID=1770053 RepID=UPI0038B3BDD3
MVAPRGRWLPSLVWLIPLIAAVIGLSLVARAIFEQGPTVTITFKTAEGIEPGKTKVKYKDVDIGEVKSVTLSEDHSLIVATVELTKDASNIAVEGTRFWVVKPRIAASGVSGLGTLLSGSYIGVDAGRSEETRRAFRGLETPPAVTRDQKGHQYLLFADSLNSLDIGSPVYYRRIQVGQVVGYALAADGKSVQLRVFVNAPYDKYVGGNTRFWNASGVDLRLDSNGLKLNTQSLTTVVLGGVAFQTPPGQPVGAQAEDNHEFLLTDDEGTAMRPPDGPATYAVLNFNQSLRGLQVGAPVDFRGIVLGNVVSIGINYDRRSGQFMMPVRVKLYPNRLGTSFAALANQHDDVAKEHLFEAFIRRGLRAQLRTGNFLTGQLYVALDFFPKVPPAKIDVTRSPLELPTVPNTLDQLQLQVADIASKLQKIPFDKIGNNVNQTLESANSLFKRLDGEVAPEAQRTLVEAQKTFSSAEKTLSEDSPLQSDVRQAMQELTRTARTLGVLADYLERHPEALLRGKPGEKP